jgi:hypothetical protein
VTTDLAAQSPLAGQIPMPFTLKYQVEDLYENGLLNSLRTLPGNFPEQKRLEIESVVYTAYGIYRIYRRLEQRLISETTINGKFSGNASESRELFSDVWSLIDAFYAISRLSRSKYHSEYLIFSEDTSRLLKTASDFRSFMDHIDQNFANTINAKGWFPLFGWLTYQYTPCAVNFSEPHNLIFFVNISSTYIRSEYKISVPDHTRASVRSAVDRISLHLKNGKYCNITDLFVNISLDLNRYSIKIQNFIQEFLLRPENQKHGIQIPFGDLTIRGDLHEQSIEFHEIKSKLDENKIRIKVTIDGEH